ncbi:MAG TPA: serine hydrolase [Limnochordia bacterium]
MDETWLARARDYACSGGGSGYVVRHGRLAYSWGDPRVRYDLKSTTKSIGVTAVGLAVADGLMRWTDPAARHQPAFGVPPAENAQTGWLERITLLHLATHTAGFEKPGGYGRLLFEPGTAWHYSDGGTNWLAECVTLACGRDLFEWMTERVFRPLEIAAEDLVWRQNAYRPATIDGLARREFGAGVHANVDAMARIGYLYLHRGEWRGQRILPADFVDEVSRPVQELSELPVHAPDTLGPEVRPGAPAAHYGRLWWNNADRTLADVPEDAFWAWGLYDSVIIVVPSLDLVVTRAGGGWPRRPGERHYDPLGRFLSPIVAAASGSGR